MASIYLKPIRTVNRQFTKFIVCQCRFEYSTSSKQEVVIKPPPVAFVTNEVIPVFKRAAGFTERVALTDKRGSYSYFGLLQAAHPLSKQISQAVRDKNSERIAFLCPNDASYLITQWAIWMSGQIAVPLSHLHPPEMLEYFVKDCESKLIITTPKYAEILDQVASKTRCQLHVVDDSSRRLALHDVEKPILELDREIFRNGLPVDFYARSGAMILYTSGTTGPPKGALLTHKNVQAQTQALIRAWEFSNRDIVLHSLPLNHMHGIICALMPVLYTGGRINMLPTFEPDSVWANLLGVNIRSEDRPTVFMGVPTMYSKLISEFDRMFSKNPKMVEYVKSTLSTKLRLMISGSAPLPVPVYNRWEEISGHRLLERYGMTEIGMCLSAQKPLLEPGYVGLPLPGVSVKLARYGNSGEYETLVEANGSDLDNVESDPSVQIVTKEKQELPSGELLVKGNSVFKEYYNRIDETRSEFTVDGWFRTGDTALYDPQKNMFKLLGRTSVDIIKTGGYKVSSLHVETMLLEHPDIKEVVVVALPDVTWGQKVAAIVVLNDSTTLMLPRLREWAKTKMAEYCVPTVMKVVETLPRNTMGKVNKKDLVKTIFPEELTN